MQPIVIGTAGHIDHGKTALVKALTGMDADRLEEEKRRGITIDLGFAHLDLSAADGTPLRLSFIDVPGHEKFVRNMLAGVGGIDLVLFVIAADEGVMPQTREHFEICRLLGIAHGITVLTKCDLVDADSLALVRGEVADFLRGSFLDAARAPLIEVSAKSGAGIDGLKQALVDVATQVRARDTEAIFRLPIDRVFTMQGFGTVVTGTLLAGTLSKEQEIEVQPGGMRARIRGLEVHGQPTEVARAGERTALNLAGVNLDKADLHRGQVLVPPATLIPTRRCEVALTLSAGAKPLRNRSRVHLHAFTADVVAEVVLHAAPELQSGAQAYAQLRIAADHEALLVNPGDRFIIRQFSPMVTIGGGTVIDAHPLNKRLSGAALAGFLARLHAAGDAEKLFLRIERRESAGMKLEDAILETGWTRDHIRSLAARLEGDGAIIAAAGHWLSSASWSAASQALLGELTQFHARNPLAAGVAREPLRSRLRLSEPVFAALINALAEQKKIAASADLIHLAEHKVVLRSDESAAHKTIEDAFRNAGLKVPALKEVLMGLPLDRIRAQKIVTLLLRDKLLVKITDDLVFHHSALESLKQRMRVEKAKSPQLDVARFKDLTGVSRKYAIPLLEWLDRERVTRRVGEGRVIL